MSNNKTKVNLTVKTKLLLLSSIVAASISANVNANDVEQPWNFSILGSYLDPDSDRFGATDSDDDFGLGLALGHRFNPKWEGRFIGNFWNFDESVNAYGLDALYHFNDHHLYGIAGLKHVDYPGDGNEILNLGVGKRFVMDNNLYFTAEALVDQSLEDSYNDLGLNLGVTYLFGEQSSSYKPTPAPKPTSAPKPVLKDSDGDGVYDKDDACPNTPSIDAVDSNGCTKYKMSEDTIRLSVNFANDSDVVDKSYYSEIEGVANFMKKYPDATVVIEGHTSARGDAAYNQNLSERRAKMVADIMVNQYDIAQSRVSSVGYGETRLLDTTNTSEAHRKNRRIEARISGSKRVKVRR